MIPQASVTDPLARSIVDTLRRTPYGFTPKTLNELQKDVDASREDILCALLVLVQEKAVFVEKATAGHVIVRTRLWGDSIAR